MKKHKILCNQEPKEVEELSISLFSVSPIGQHSDSLTEDALPSHEVTEFNTVAHVRQLESLFNYFH